MRSGQLNAFSLVLSLISASACGNPRPCDANQRYGQGMCLPVAAPAPDAAIAMPSDAGAGSEAGSCAQPANADLGKDCKLSGQCGCSAPFCAVNPVTSEGLCTVTGCSTAPDDCPKGYSCLDL